MIYVRDNRFLRNMCRASTGLTVFLLVMTTVLGAYAVMTRRDYTYFYSSEYIVKPVYHFNQQEIRANGYGKEGRKAGTAQR